VLPRVEPGLEEVLLDRAPELVQPHDLAAAGLPAVEVVERRPAPEVEGAGKGRRRPVGIAGRDLLAAPLGQPFEAADVDVVVRQAEPVAAGRRPDRGRAERLADVRHADLHLLGGRRRGRITPQRVGQNVRADHLAPPHRQDAQHDAVTGAEHAAAVDHQWPEKGDCHGRIVDLTQRGVNGTDTRRIPGAPGRRYRCPPR
jgi:hypothetical protein